MDGRPERIVAGVVPQHVSRDDRDKVVAWRLEQTMELGFVYADASAFAESDGDLHQLAELLHKGCPPMTALRIAS